MNLPEAIQRQVEEAEALEKHLYAQSEDPAPEPVEPAPQPEPEPGPQPEPEPQPAPVDADKRTEDANYWKHRFNTVQGMLNAQSAQFTEQLRLSNERIQQLREELDRQKQQQPAPAQLDDKDADVFGADLVDAIDRRAEQKAREQAQEQTKELAAYIKQLEAQLGMVGQQVGASAQERFTQQLTQLVPTWAAVNQDAGFLTWLGEADPVYGVARQAALDAAANALDADRVAKIFSAYINQTTPAAPARQQVRKELERQTTPSASKGAGQTPTAGKVYTNEEYVAAMDPRNALRMGREAAEALAADAEAAYYEGRVRF